MWEEKEKSDEKMKRMWKKKVMGKMKNKRGCGKRGKSDAQKREKLKGKVMWGKGKLKSERGGKV